MNNDLISREALKKYARKVMCEKDFMTKIHLEFFENIIDNAPTVDIKDQIAGAYNEGYMCGNKEAEKARPQGDWRDNLIEVFRQSAEVGGDTFHLFEIERIINGEPI